MRLIPSPPEASSSPFGLKRTTLTALVCLARLDRNSTTAFPSPSWSTRHNCRVKPKYIIHPLAMKNVTRSKNAFFPPQISYQKQWKKTVFTTQWSHEAKLASYKDFPLWIIGWYSRTSDVNRFCSHSPWLLCPLQLLPTDERVHHSRAGSPGCKLVPYCAKQFHRLPPSYWVIHEKDLKSTKVLKIHSAELNVNG